MNDENNKKTNPSNANKILIALWSRAGGDFDSMVLLLESKIKFDKKENEAIAEREIEAVEKIGGRIVTALDADYPNDFKKLDQPYICFIEKNGQFYSDKPINDMK